MGNKLYSFSFKTCKIMEPPSLVVVILGSTGTGKSKLAIELSKKFKGEIISADSMQVYNGLDIVTNKVSARELEEAHHHMINCVDPYSRFTVVDFQNQALPIIENLLKQKKRPIVVGGTNYYIESLLWDVLIKPQVPKDKLLFDSDCKNGLYTWNHDSKESSENIKIEDLLKHKITQDSLIDVPSLLLHQALKQIDPVMANTLHPKDRRKVIRSLQVYQQHGQYHSKLLDSQRNQDGGSSLGGPLRYKNCVMLWLQCEKDVLHQRLDERVDEMIRRGLVKELLNFHKVYNERRIQNKLLSKSLYEEGIFQSIGFKEFHEYLILSDDEKNSENGQKLLVKAIEDMKLVTRQYSRKQNKWVINRFLRQPRRQLPPVYGLNATDVNKWNEDVLQPAVDIVQSLLKGQRPAAMCLPVADGLNDVAETHYCEICERIFVGRRVWEIHLASKKHNKRKASLKKQEHKSITCLA